MTQLKCFGIGSCFCSFVLSSSFLFRCCWFSCNGMDAPSFCAFFHVQMRCVALELLSNLSIQTRRVICRVNIVNSSFFFPPKKFLVFVVRLKCWWFHQGIRISNQNKTCKILYNKKIWYWKLHIQKLSRDGLDLYVSQKKDVTSLVII